MQKLLKISVVGAGKVGSAILQNLSKKGYPVVSIIDKNIKSALRLATKVECKKYSYNTSDIDKETEMLFITTPDDVIAKVAKEISADKKLKFKNMFVAHTSGVQTSAVLKPLKSKGATVFSMHPIQSFPKDISINRLEKNIQNIYFGFEGEAGTYSIASRLASELGGKIISIDKKLKPLYHIACVFASNYIVTNLNIVSEISSLLKIDNNWSDVFRPLTYSSIENALTLSPKEALTGPIERGDLETVKMHIEALKKYAPDLMSYYLLFGVETARLARAKGSLTPEKFSLLIKYARETVKKNKKEKK
jgi:predicted short-subunit dehydrogenase-like oxidoreductase (DUF2520 family)